MKAHYIFHSGFLVETEGSYYIFDYYKGELPELRRDKPAVVFVSHSHQDHYNPEIFHILRERGIKDMFAVLAKDIPRRRHPEGVELLRALSSEKYTLPGGETLETLLSTDCGVAYLLTAPEGTVYHAGDLNDWTWEGESEQYNCQMRGSYRHEIDKLCGREIDIAFLPLDPRQREQYAAGMRYFLDRVKVKSAYPMHYWEDPGVIDRFLSEYPQYAEIVNNTEDIKL